VGPILRPTRRHRDPGRRPERHSDRHPSRKPDSNSSDAGATPSTLRCSASPGCSCSRAPCNRVMRSRAKKARSARETPRVRAPSATSGQDFEQHRAQHRPALNPTMRWRRSRRRSTFSNPRLVDPKAIAATTRFWGWAGDVSLRRPCIARCVPPWKRPRLVSGRQSPTATARSRRCRWERLRRSRRDVAHVRCPWWHRVFAALLAPELRRDQTTADRGSSWGADRSDR
jgi:hypothetical protein